MRVAFFGDAVGAIAPTSPTIRARRSGECCFLERARRATGISGGKLRYEAPAGPDLRAALRLRALHSVPSTHRASGAVWEIAQRLIRRAETAPDNRPPIYPCTGWYRDGWASKWGH